MKKINSILGERFKQQESPNKINALAEKSANRPINFFSVSELSDNEKSELKSLLERYSNESDDFSEDLKSLSAITLEVKVINNQAALLHGERIKKAQTLLKKYNEGAFSAWLMAIYGNRQTPYNFLQYYEFYEAVSKEVHPLIDAMPRQAVYTLASREGSLEKKIHLVKEAAGKTKQELLNTIREHFPLRVEDKRSSSAFIALLNNLQRARSLTSSLSFTKEQKEAVIILLDSLYSTVGKRK